ncbi:MAG: hypothetical protein HOJ35_00455 [Bdellovibrionales bacterium]|nr:hypothetical protein [Bdellovibrionales bacterium]
MNLSNPFKGKIYFSDPRSNSKKYLHYSFTHPDKIPLTEKFIYRFKSLKMCKNEKKKLSSHHREFLYGYKNIDINQINQFVDSLAKKIDMYQNSKINIKGNHVGALICLAYILSKKHNSNKEITFELSMIPLRLFPKQLIPKTACKKENFQVRFLLEADNWILPFKSLYDSSRLSTILDFTFDEYSSAA